MTDQASPTGRAGLIETDYEIGQDNIQPSIGPFGLDIHNPVFLISGLTIVAFVFFALALPGQAGARFEWLPPPLAPPLARGPGRRRPGGVPPRGQPARPGPPWSRSPPRRSPPPWPAAGGGPAAARNGPARCRRCGGARSPAGRTPATPRERRTPRRPRTRRPPGRSRGGRPRPAPPPPPAARRARGGTRAAVPARTAAGGGRGGGGGGPRRFPRGRRGAGGRPGPHPRSCWGPGARLGPGPGVVCWAPRGAPGWVARCCASGGARPASAAHTSASSSSVHLHDQSPTQEVDRESPKWL